MEKEIKEINVLTVCGAGTVTSTMLASRVKDILGELGIYVNVVGIRPQEVENYIDREQVDLIVTSTPISGDISVPIVKGVPLLTGVGEDECVQEIIDKAKKALEKKNQINLKGEHG